MRAEVVRSLVCTSATDGNFRIALKSATTEEMRQALSEIRPKGNKMRIAAIEKELKCNRPYEAAR